MKLSRGKEGLLLHLPAICILVFMMIIPLGYLVVLTFTNYEPTGTVTWAAVQFVGLANFARFFNDDVVLAALGRTFLLLVLGLGIQIPLGLGMALALGGNSRVEGALKVIFLLPVFMSPVVVGVIWRHIMNPDYGILNYIFQQLHLPLILWLSDPNTAFVSLALVDSWQWTPFVFLICLAGLSTVPIDALESAEIDGASRLQKLRYMTIPLMKWPLFIALIFRFVDIFRIFDIAYTLTGGGPNWATDTISLRAYRIGMRYSDLNYGATISWILVFLLLASALLLIRAFRPPGWFLEHDQKT